MKNLILILFCIVGVTYSHPPSKCDGPNPEVTAPTGRIRGSLMTSRHGRKIFSFRGVRYAEPPTGPRRFQIATPAADWSNVFDASEEGPNCPNFGGKIPSEDCLRLNVYTTKLPSHTKNGHEKRPVLVFFHPGGFYTYSGQSSFFGPQYLMDKDLVLVTVNYRLGSLGFFSTGDALAPGNLGLKDQVVALRWIKRNIAAFGGDPNSVTISGDSAGGVSCLLHMLSPMSKGLFHRAVSMSGSLLATEPYPTQQKHYAVKQAQLLGCPSDDTAKMILCLQSKPVENFTSTMSQFFEFYGDPILVWAPVVEPKNQPGEAFLTEQPAVLITEGKINDVPLLIGITKDEFGGISLAFEKPYREGVKTAYDEINQKFDEIAPISFLYERGTPRSANITRQLKEFYFNNQPISSANYQGIADLYADSVVIFGVHRGAKLFAAHSKEPVYFYKFTYQGRYSYAMWDNSTPYGVEHQDDLQYLFFMKDVFPYIDLNAPESPMVDRHIATWTSFMYTGYPVPRDNALFKDLKWDRFVPEQDNYMDINLNPSMKKGIYPARMQLWERLSPLSRLLDAAVH